MRFASRFVFYACYIPVSVVLLKEPHEDFQPLRGDAETFPAGFDLGPDFFRVKPADFIHFTFLQFQRPDVNRLPVDIDPGYFIIPERFFIKDLFVLDAELSGKSQLIGGSLDAQFFLQFPKR